MQSPTLEPSDGIGAVDLTTLSLEPALQSTGKASHNIFAFESGSTWGNSNATAATANDWGMPPGTNFGSTSESHNSNAIPASFLSLSTGSTWGGFEASGGQSPASKD